ncbi:hypothetical protein ONZ51_g5593 [Trametes cubensis]|uniref:Uncharacterized protein n=1 Tax=Trametes cubensis TaxID=1111947 RepID=A0AAD7TTR8_9APHY|nr:hypothetical protein ONZ51_g5593 [Trametes cubensis]
MAAYGILETHRQIAATGKCHNHPMEINPFTILIPSSSLSCAGAARSRYPWSSLQEGHHDARGPRGIFVDFDCSPTPEIPGFEDFQALRSTWVAPMCTARATAMRFEAPTSTSIHFRKMPTLSDKAKSAYVRLHGEDRYLRYCDGPNRDTYHGGVHPPIARPGDLRARVDSQQFRNRLWYDAESMFWALYATLLRVVPLEGAIETKESAKCLRYDWGVLEEYTIPLPLIRRDCREQLVSEGDYVFSAAFLPGMVGVADLLYAMAGQVVPCYALMDQPPLLEDHLHEAMQRLILDYLVENQETPIPLKPGSFRRPAVPTRVDEDDADT